MCFIEDWKKTEVFEGVLAYKFLVSYFNLTIVSFIINLISFFLPFIKSTGRINTNALRNVNVI